MVPSRMLQLGKKMATWMDKVGQAIDSLANKVASHFGDDDDHEFQVASEHNNTLDFSSDSGNGAGERGDNSNQNDSSSEASDSGFDSMDLFEGQLPKASFSESRLSNETSPIIDLLGYDEVLVPPSNHSHSLPMESRFPSNFTTSKSSPPNLMDDINEEIDFLGVFHDAPSLYASNVSPLRPTKPTPALQPKNDLKCKTTDTEATATLSTLELLKELSLSLQDQPSIDTLKLIEDRVNKWKGSKGGNLRYLLVTLDKAVWPAGVTWIPPKALDLLDATAVKAVYRKIVAKVHPDKWQNAPHEDSLLSNLIFCTLNEAWELFRTQNNL